jgi:hypothetical protein
MNFFPTDATKMAALINRISMIQTSQLDYFPTLKKRKRSELYIFNVRSSSKLLLKKGIIYEICISVWNNLNFFLHLAS